ncbi:hypothetical protein XENORESO_005695 [Xenotaenia resolanae]|uniref:Uncharacterized protein n=1 Tax=Xenotaenia resolanae TaxID=208358 RepID=A0ABV0W2B3_9TELE
MSGECVSEFTLELRLSRLCLCVVICVSSCVGVLGRVDVFLLLFSKLLMDLWSRSAEGFFSSLQQINNMIVCVSKQETGDGERPLPECVCVSLLLNFFTGKTPQKHNLITTD